MQLFPNTAGGGVFIPDTLYGAVMESCVSSAEMKEYLLQNRIDADKISELILGAPIPLIQKQSHFKRLYEFKPFIFSEYFCEFNLAVNALEAKTGEFFMAEQQWYDFETKDKESEVIAPFATWDKAVGAIQKSMVIDEWEPNDCVWGLIEKWSLQNGDYDNPYTFYLINGEPEYFTRNIYDDEDLFWRAEFRGYVNSVELNLPMPFSAGDIVTLDCMPFAPIKHALLLYVDNIDCCGVRMLYRDIDGLWKDAALKHGHGWGRYSPMLSPLCRLSSFDNTLPEDEKLLKKIQSELNYDAQKSRKLSDMMLKTDSDGLNDEGLIKLIKQI